MSELDNKQTFTEIRGKRAYAKTASWISLILAVLSAFAAAKTFTQLLPFNQTKISTQDPLVEEYKRANAEFQKEMKETHRQLDAIDKALNAAPTSQPELALSVAVTEMRTRVATIDGRIKALEDAITSSPEKALSIPLLRKDVELIQKSQGDEKVSVNNDLARLYDLNKWFLTSIVTIVLATIGIAITNAFKTPPKT